MAESSAILLHRSTHHDDFEGAIRQGTQTQMLAADSLVNSHQITPPKDIGALKDGHAWHWQRGIR